MFLRKGGPQQPTQLLLVAWRSDDEVGKLAQGREREHALVAGAVLPHQPGTIDADDHRGVVLADIVHDLVEGTLQERRVERHEGPLARQRHAGGHGHGMLLRDTDVVDAVRERLAERGHAGTGGHARGDGHHPRIFARDLHELTRHDRGVVG